MKHDYINTIYRMFLAAVIFFSLTGIFACGGEDYYGPYPANPDSMYDVIYKVQSAHYDGMTEAEKDAFNLELAVSWLDNISSTISVTVKTLPFVIDLVPCGDWLPYCGYMEYVTPITFQMDVDNNGDTLNDITVQVIINGVEVDSDVWGTFTSADAAQVSYILNP